MEEELTPRITMPSPRLPVTKYKMPSVDINSVTDGKQEKLENTELLSQRQTPTPTQRQKTVEDVILKHVLNNNSKRNNQVQTSNLVTTQSKDIMPVRSKEILPSFMASDRNRDLIMVTDQPSERAITKRETEKLDILLGVDL